jgi:hypothetical protein
VDDGLPRTDDAAAPRPTAGTSRAGQPPDPRREAGSAGHPTGWRARRQPVEPLAIGEDPDLDRAPAPRAEAAALRGLEDLDALLDRGPVTLPAIVAGERLVPAGDQPSATAPTGIPVLPLANPVTPASTATPWSSVARAQQAQAQALASPRHPRVRRVTRVVRHVDAWSVFKVAVVFNLFLYVVTLTAGVLLWQVAQNTGTVDNIQRFFENFGWKSFTLHGGEIFHNAWVAGLFLVVGMTGFAVLLATLFNLITDLVGGIRVSVLEEEVVARDATSGSGRAGSDLAQR